MTSKISIVERMRARRAAMQDTSDTIADGETTISPRPSPRVYDTWAAAMEDTVEAGAATDSSTAELLDEVKESDALVKKLRKKRKQQEKELSDVMETKEHENVEEKLKHVKKKSKQKVLQETQKRPERPEGVTPLPLLDDDGDPSIIPEEQDDVDGAAMPEELLAQSGRSTGKSTGRLTGKSTSRDDATAAATPRRLSATVNQSIRQRLIEKRQSAIDKGASKAMDESRTERRLAGMRKLQKVTRTRFDDPSMMSEEEADFERKASSIRDKWKKSTEKIIKQSILPTPEEQYDFFTRNWEAEPEEKMAEPKKEKEKKPEAATAEDDIEAAADDTEDAKKERDADKPDDEQPLLGVEDFEENAWRFYQLGRAQYTPRQEQLDKEDKKYFIPSMMRIPADKKIFDQEQPRYLEDEGFFVGVRPVVPPRNQNRMEARLLQQDDQGRGWFGEDGMIIALPDPLKDIPSRPPVAEEPEPALETFFHKGVAREFDSRYIDGMRDTSNQYQLDVDVNTIVLTHHHLFSREHVLSARLTELYNQYLSRSQKNVVQFLTEKLKALKAALYHVQENIANLAVSDGTGDNQSLDQESRVKIYQEEIKQSRKQRELEMGADRSLMKNIIKTWKDLKDLRAYQKYNNTSVKLHIRKEVSDKAKDEEEWEQDIEDEVQEIKAEKEMEYQEKLKEYKVLLAEWKKHKLRHKEASKRQKKRDRKQASRTDVQSMEDEEEAAAGNDEDQALIDKDRQILNEDVLPKPEKPEPPQDEMLKDRIREKYQEIRRRPGEPKLYPELSHGVTVHPANQCPRGEQQRRDELNRTRLYVKVLFNNKEVSRTTAKPIGQDFVIRFAQIFNVQIVQWPESIKFQIYEKSGLSDTLLAEIFTSIPEANVTTDTVQLDDTDFSSDQRVSHGHEGVGSGVPFSFDKDNTTMLSLMTTGVLSSSIAWAVDQQGNVLVPPSAISSNAFYSAMKNMDAVAAIGASGMADMDKLTKWISEAHLDPNDPSNADLMHLLRPVGGGDMVVPSMRMPEYFRLEQLQEEFNFARDEELDASRRYRLIQMRENEVPEFRNYKMIPMFDKEVPADAFKEYENKQKEEEKARQMDKVESHRAEVARFMQRVREQVMIRFRIASHQKTLPDVVFEDAVPNIGTIIPNLIKMTEPRRPLRPTRKERKKVNPQNLQSMDVNVLVNIVRAFDIPVRAESSGTSKQAPLPSTSAAGSTSPGVQRQNTIRNIAGETLVRPYVEVMFQRNVHATSVADGPNPSWNEELQIPFRAPNNDYSSTNLQTVNDVLYFSLFDEYIVDVLEDERERGTNIHRRIEKRWLGSLKIPFSTIYFNTRIDGTFRINKPPVLLGYTNQTTKTVGDIDMGIGDRDSTYLTMFVTIEPQLAPAEPFKEKFDSNEDPKLLEYADRWLADLEKKNSTREYKATVVDINGKSVFLTRYFKALKPPAEILPGGDDSTKNAEAVARFVSMIPFVSDSVVFPGLCDIWSTCDQFLQMLQGDEEEHAVLLACLFMSVGKKTFLICGSAIPEGPTAYVMTREVSDYWIWNASTGEHFNYRDNYCPLQSIGCLVNDENIWANIQANEQPCCMSFDLSNTSDWKPFFNKSFPNPGITSVQPENLIFVETEKNYVLDLQDKIERILKQKVMEWRPRSITRWNRYCMQAFRQLLIKLEATRGKGVQDEHVAELENILGSYKMTGFPVNMPFTEMDPIIESVYATGVHNNESKDVEFALAVHIHAYPNTVLSVWVYVANLIRKR